MKNATHRILGLIALLSGLLFAGIVPAAETPAAGKIRVLVVTGGHDFEKAPFFKLFENDPGISYQAVEHPQAHALLRPAAAEQFDVLVLYDMWQDISDEAKADFVNLLKRGKGLVALHHCLASYQKWDEYARIIGGKYYLDKHNENGIEQPGSTYQHGVKFTVQIAQPPHPVTKGMTNFDILDETYGKFVVNAEVTPLLTTAEPTSSKTIGWAHTYGVARVVYIELGHDHLAYENTNYPLLLARAIRLTAPKRH
jgi:type 1 glutamine amidotransferase